VIPDDITIGEVNMNNKSNSKIVGLGTYLPNRKLTNYDLEKMVDTSDEWIVRRTGVRKCHRDRCIDIELKKSVK